MPDQVRKFVRFEEEVRHEDGAAVSPPLRRTAVGAVLTNPLVGVESDGLDVLIDISRELGETLTRRALQHRDHSAGIRSYGKAVVVGTAGALEHGAAMIHPQLGMSMRRTIGRGHALIPGIAKVAAAGTAVDLPFGPVDEVWDLDAMDAMSVCVADAPRPDEILLLVGYAFGPRPNARCKGPTQADVEALFA
jgi:hypothetical protein